LASLWGRVFSSLYAYIKALGRIIMKNFRHRDTIIYVHAKIIDGTCLYLLYNLIVHRTSSFLKVLIGCTLSFAMSSHRVEDIVCDASGISKRCAREIELPLYLTLLRIGFMIGTSMARSKLPKTILPISTCSLLRVRFTFCTKPATHGRGGI